MLGVHDLDCRKNIMRSGCATACTTAARSTASGPQLVMPTAQVLACLWSLAGWLRNNLTTWYISLSWQLKLCSSTAFTSVCQIIQSCCPAVYGLSCACQPDGESPDVKHKERPCQFPMPCSQSNQGSDSRKVANSQT